MSILQSRFASKPFNQRRSFHQSLQSIPNEATQRINALNYCRFSTYPRCERSIENQVELSQAYASHESIHISEAMRIEPLLAAQSHEDQPLNVPLRSLKRSSLPGGRTSGVYPDKAADATEVNDEDLPHNSCTAGEIGWLLSPA